jgi:transposase InsO family protein
MNTETDEPSQTWICVDGASTTHVANTKQQAAAMTNIRETKEVMLMNDHPCKIQQRGDLLVTWNGVRIQLQNVAYVPASRHCLLSITKLLDFYKEGSVLHTRSNMIIDLGNGDKIKGERKENLYFFPGTIGLPSASAFFSSTTADSEDSDVVSQQNKFKFDYAYTSEDTDESNQGRDTKNFGAMKAWPEPGTSESSGRMTVLHQRLGHVGLRALKDVLRTATAISDSDAALFADNDKLKADLRTKPEDLPCEPCALAKSRRQHPKHATKRRKRVRWRTPLATTAANEVKTPEGQITADTAGPNKRTRRGKKYLHVVVLDDHAYSEVALGQHKDEASEHIMDNLFLWKDSIKSPITLKTDRGGEYRSNSFEKWLKRHGVHHKLTAPNSSSGSAEKKIDTIQNLSKAMMNDAQAPNTLWGEAAKYANTITLMVPSASKKLEGRSPWESRWKKPPPLHKLHRWGCEAFVNIPKSRKAGRQGNKARKGMFIGLCEDQNDGWRFYDADLNSIFTGRSATFHDGVMYYEQRKLKSAKNKAQRLHLD